MLDELQKQVCKAAEHTLAASLLPLDHSENVIILDFFIGIILEDVFLKGLNWLFLIFLWFFCFYS